MTPDPQIRQALAPSGALRAAVNLGNPVLAQGSPEAPTGITVDLAHEIARRLGVAVELVTFDGAGKAVRAMADGEADICFLAIDPTRAESVAFSPAYVHIEGVYAVPLASDLTSAAEVDRTGVRIGVKEGSAYDLHLSREIRDATIVRGREGLDVFVEQQLEVGAGIRQPVERFVGSTPGYRVLEPAFMQIRQAVGVARPVSPEVEAFLTEAVSELLASGFVSEALERSGQSRSLAAPGVTSPDVTAPDVTATQESTDR